jgi:hypothetical protein
MSFESWAAHLNDNSMASSQFMIRTNVLLRLKSTPLLSLNEEWYDV